MDTTIYASRVGRTPDQATFMANNPPRPQPVYNPAAQWAPSSVRSVVDDWRKRDDERLAQQTQSMSDALRQSNNPPGVQVVHGSNIQNDLPTGNEAPLQSNGPSAPVDTLPLQQAQVASGGVDVGQDMAPPGWKYDAPPMPKDPTNGVKSYTPEHVSNAQDAITFSMQNVLPPAQTPVQQATQAQDHAKMQSDIQYVASAKNPKTAWQELKKEPFYKNSDFYTGMMNVGLAIMSGANPMQAYQAGKESMDKASMSSQLGGNRQALIDQGYSPASVEAAITSGDVSKLRMQEMSDEDKMAAMDDQWARRQDYANQLGAQQTEAANAEWDRRNAINQQNQMQLQQAADRRAQERMAASEAQQKRMVDYRAEKKQEAAKQAAESFDFGSRDINAEKNTPEGANIRQWATKKGYFTAADKEHQIAQDAIAAYEKEGGEANRQKAVAAFKQLIFNLARGEIGENRSLQGSDLAEFAEDPSIPVRTVNDIKLKAGFTPTLDALRYVKAGIDTGIDSMNYNIDNTKEQRIRAVAKTLGPRKATALVNRAFGSGWHDPLNAFGTGDEAPSRQGALSGAGSDDLNGF